MAAAGAAVDGRGGLVPGSAAAAASCWFLAACVLIARASAGVRATALEAVNNFAVISAALKPRAFLRD